MLAELLYQKPCILGEGPFWHAARNSVFWVDIEGRSIFELNWKSQHFKEWRIGHRVSLILLGKDDAELFLALQGGIAVFNLETEKLKWLADIEKDLPGNRSNDGACDSRGRLWLGTMDLNFKAGAGSLYCVEKGFEVRKELHGVTISNGLVWSLDNQCAYYIDSPTQTICAYHFDEERGRFSFEKIAVRIPESLGTPDGMCIDSEGKLWVAHWGGFGVYCWDPEKGTCLDKVEVNAPNVSSCAFGGENMDRLLITTARQQMSQKELDRYPLSGSLFTARLNVHGLSNHLCNL